MTDDKHRTLVDWHDWSQNSFEKARSSKKLVLLDLSASWCHWCHVMDSTTYSDKEVAREINEFFVPIRVDIDHRPDISERYNRGGFPTTVFLSDQGESVWGATYVPPNDMLRIMKSILQAKESGEIDQALERSRMRYLDLSKSMEKRERVDRAFIEDVFEDIFSEYDVQEGGFGVAPKFPHADVIEMILLELATSPDEGLSNAVRHTLDKMIDGIGDPVEGGVFRYSVTRDWKTPHYEKMLETNIGFLRNLVRAYVVLGDEKYKDIARSIAGYLLSVLHDEISGGFYGSQDADEIYYKLSLADRRRRKAPAVDRTVYAGWNCEASSTFMQAGYVLVDKALVKVGQEALRFTTSRLWNPDIGLVRHVGGQDTYLFEDQVSFLRALLSSLEYSCNEDMDRTIDTLIEGVDRHFSSPEGGYNDVMQIHGAIGELGEPRRPLVANSMWASAIASYGVLAGRQDLVVKARETLDSFPPREIEMHGLFGATYVIAWRSMNGGPRVVKVESPEEDALDENLWTSTRLVTNPGDLVVFRHTPSDKASAVICSDDACSKPISEPAEILRILGRTSEPSPSSRSV